MKKSSSYVEDDKQLTLPVIIAYFQNFLGSLRGRMRLASSDDEENELFILRQSCNPQTYTLEEKNTRKR